MFRWTLTAGHPRKYTCFDVLLVSMDLDSWPCWVVRRCFGRCGLAALALIGPVLRPGGLVRPAGSRLVRPAGSCPVRLGLCWCFAVRLGLLLFGVFVLGCAF